MISAKDVTDKLPKVELPKLDLTNFDLSKVELPKFDMPKLEMSKVEMPQEVARVADFARDAAYVGLGAVVVSVQAADGRRRELTTQLTSQFRKVVGATA